MLGIITQISNSKLSAISFCNIRFDKCALADSKIDVCRTTLYIPHLVAFTRKLIRKNNLPWSNVAVLLSTVILILNAAMPRQRIVQDSDEEENADPSPLRPGISAPEIPSSPAGTGSTGAYLERLDLN